MVNPNTVRDAIAHLENELDQLKWELAMTDSPRLMDELRQEIIEIEYDLDKWYDVESGEREDY